MSSVRIVPPTRLAAAAENRDRAARRRLGSSKQLFLGARGTACHSACSCQVSSVCPACFEPLLDRAREGEVHVVAAEQDVVADGDALERELAACLRRPRSG